MSQAKYHQVENPHLLRYCVKKLEHICYNRKCVFRGENILVKLLISYVHWESLIIINRFYITNLVIKIIRWAYTGTSSRPIKNTMSADSWSSANFCRSSSSCGTPANVLSEKCAAATLVPMMVAIGFYLLFFYYVPLSSF